MKKLFCKKNFITLGIFFCSGMTIINLVCAIIVSLIASKEGTSLSSYIYDVISYGINTLFYLYLTNTFYKAKNNFGYCSQAIYVLLLCNYIVPLVLNLIEILASNIITGVWGLGIITLSSICAIVYFILLLVSFRKGLSKKINISLIVFGSILAFLSFSNFSIELFFIIFSYVIDNTVFSMYSIALDICIVVVSFFTFLESFLYMGFAITLYRERNNNYW